MSLIIGVVSQKGGVGKSTLARCLAREYASSDWAVKIADMDTSQSTSLNWASRRLDAKIEPLVPVEQFNRIDLALKQSENYDLMIFDGAPHATATTKSIAKASNLTILPTGFSLDDLIPTIRLAHELKKEGLPSSQLAIAFCRTGDSRSEAQEAAEYVHDAGYYLLDGLIPDRTAYRRAMDIGMTVTETKFQSLNHKADQLIASVVRRVQELDNKGELKYG